MRPPVLRASDEVAADELVRPREAGRFVAGHAYGPATQIARGQRLSPRTEFKPGMPAGNKLPVGSVRVRVETHTGLLRAWVKTAEPNVWRKRAVLVWEAARGPVARGSVIHHRDRDSLNDTIENLVALTRRAHAEEHKTELLLGAVMALRALGVSA